MVGEALLLLAVALGVLAYFSHKALRQEAMRDAEQTLEGTVQDIDNILMSVEQSAGNVYFDLVEHLDNPSRMHTYSRKLVESNPNIIGCIIAFKPGYYPGKDLFMAHVHRKSSSADDLSNFEESETFADHPYTEQLWFTESMKNGRTGWIDPLKGTDTDNEPMVSFCQPISDKTNQRVGVMAVNVSINLLSKIILAAKPSENGYTVLLAHNGSYIVHPDKEKLTNPTIFSQMEQADDHRELEAAESMLAGESGMKEFRRDHRDWCVFYKPFERVEWEGRTTGKSGWSVGVVCPEEDIFGTHNVLIYQVLAIAVAGMLLLFLLWSWILRNRLKPQNGETWNARQLSRRLSLSMTLLAAPVFILSLGLFFVQSYHLIHQEVTESFNSMLNTTLHRVRNYMTTVETAANSNLWMLEENFRPNSLKSVSNRIVRLNHPVISSSVFTVPDMFREYGHSFSLYTVNQGDTVATYCEPEYDYFNKACYTHPVNFGKACWIDPFIDNAEGKVDHNEAIATYCHPIRQQDGRIVGVVTADFSFSRLARMLNEVPLPYPHAYYMLLAGNGRYLIHPDTTRLFRKTIFTDVDPSRDMDIIALGHEMTAGKQGNIHIPMEGSTYHVSYLPVQGTNWSLALVCPISDAMKSYNHLGYVIVALLVIALLAILWFCRRMVNTHLESIMRGAVPLVIGLLLSVPSSAQIPYFAGTVGNGKIYGYTSLKLRPGINHQETYTTFQYGLGDHFATGVDLYTGPDCAYWGGLVRYGWNICKWYNVGAEVISSFDLNHSFKFSHLTSALYMNGAITPDGHLFWCTNTWWGVYHGADNTFSNYEYLGYTFQLNNGHAITPMIGAIHSWKFDQDVDIAAGFYYTIKNWNLYLWGNDFLKSHPRIIMGIDFAL
jgi:hypothetical protein